MFLETNSLILTKEREWFTNIFLTFVAIKQKQTNK